MFTTVYSLLSNWKRWLKLPALRLGVAAFLAIGFGLSVATVQTPSERLQKLAEARVEWQTIEQIPHRVTGAEENVASILPTPAWIGIELVEQFTTRFHPYYKGWGKVSTPFETPGQNGVLSNLHDLARNVGAWFLIAFLVLSMGAAILNPAQFASGGDPYLGVVRKFFTIVFLFYFYPYWDWMMYEGITRPLTESLMSPGVVHSVVDNATGKVGYAQGDAKHNDLIRRIQIIAGMEANCVKQAESMFGSSDMAKELLQKGGGRMVPSSDGQELLAKCVGPTWRNLPEDAQVQILRKVSTFGSIESYTESGSWWERASNWIFSPIKTFFESATEFAQNTVIGAIMQIENLILMAVPIFAFLGVGIARAMSFALAPLAIAWGMLPVRNSESHTKWFTGHATMMLKPVGLAFGLLMFYAVQAGVLAAPSLALGPLSFSVRLVVLAVMIVVMWKMRKMLDPVAMNVTEVAGNAGKMVEKGTQKVAGHALAAASGAGFAKLGGAAAGAAAKATAGKTATGLGGKAAADAFNRMGGAAGAAGTPKLGARDLFRVTADVAKAMPSAVGTAGIEAIRASGRAFKGETWDKAKQNPKYVEMKQAFNEGARRTNAAEHGLPALEQAGALRTTADAVQGVRQAVDRLAALDYNRDKRDKDGIDRSQIQIDWSDMPAIVADNADQLKVTDALAKTFAGLGVVAKLGEDSQGRPKVDINSDTLRAIAEEYAKGGALKAALDAAAGPLTDKNTIVGPNGVKMPDIVSLASQNGVIGQALSLGTIATAKIETEAARRAAVGEKMAPYADTAVAVAATSLPASVAPTLRDKDVIQKADEAELAQISARAIALGYAHHTAEGQKLLIEISKQEGRPLTDLEIMSNDKILEAVNKRFGDPVSQMKPEVRSELEMVAQRGGMELGATMEQGPVGLVVYETDPATRQTMQYGVQMQSVQSSLGDKPKYMGAPTSVFMEQLTTIQADPKFKGLPEEEQHAEAYKRALDKAVKELKIESPKTSSENRDQTIRISEHIFKSRTQD